MRIAGKAKIALISILLLGGAVSCASPPPPQVAVAPPPPPPPPPPAPPPQIAPPIALSSQVLELASTFRAAMSASSAITPDFKSGEDVANAVKIGASYEQTQLQQGAIAYVAIAALQEPSFVAAVRQHAADRKTREEVMTYVLQNPAYAQTFANSDKAAGLAIAALDSMGAKLMVSGRAVKQSAYDIQRQAWSKSNVLNAAERLTGAKDLSTRRLLASAEDVATLRKAYAGEAAMNLAGAPVAPPYSPVIQRGLAVAVIAALGEAGEANLERLKPLLQENESAYCLNMAKLNLYQCLSVSRPHYEDIFCLGQHAMMDTGACMIKAANSPTPAFIEPPKPVIAEATPAPKGKAPARKR